MQTKTQRVSKGPNIWKRLHIDLPLLLGLLTLMGFGLMVLYAASGESAFMLEKQLVRIGLSLTVMFAIAQIKKKLSEILPGYPPFVRPPLVRVCD